jgi:hypothetical protein
VETSRRHGPFDTRWPCVPQKSHARVNAPWLDAEDAAERLDWDAFSDRYFPERKRHSFEAQSAYVAYTEARERHEAAPRLSLVPAEPRVSSTERKLADAASRRVLVALAARHTPEP